MPIFTRGVGKQPMSTTLRRLIAAAREHENDPFNDTHADRVDAILTAINNRYGFSMVVMMVADCEFILQRAFHPLPEWVTDRMEMEKDGRYNKNTPGGIRTLD